MIFDFIKRFWLLNPRLEFLGHATGGIGAGGGSAPAILNSVRMKESTTGYMYRTFGTPTSQNKWTAHLIFRRCKLDSGSTQHGLIGSNTGSGSFGLYHQADKLYCETGGVGVWLKTADVFRDSSGFGAVTLAVDSAATGSNKMRIYSGLREITAFDTDTRSSFTGSPFNSAVTHAINCAWGTGYMSDNVYARVLLVDGQQLDPTAFLAADGASWKAKTKAAVRAAVSAGGGARNGWGSNGFLLPFDDVTSLTTLGYDRSQSDADTAGNNFTASGISLSSGTGYDALVDSLDNDTASATRPAGCYATFSPVAKGSAGTLSAGNLDLTGTSSYSIVPSSFGMTAGKFICEFIVPSSYGGNVFGFIKDAPSSLTTFLGNATNSWGYICDGTTYANGSGGSTHTAPTAGQAVTVALDVTGGKAYVAINGTWQNSGNPDAGTGAIWAGLSAGTYFFAATMYQALTMSANFGQRPWSSATTTALATATTFNALCSTNLPPPSVTNPASAFQAVTATESNIDSVLATARSGWGTSYVDIKKNLDATESWAWQFGHDASNEHALADSSLTYQAKRTNSGTARWAGYSIRVGAAYGTAAGSVAHTSGADTTITHNVGTSARQMVLLFSRAGGSAVPMYHPDLTAGKLLNLASGAAEATSATIKAVTASSFKIDAGTASGTYDYLVVSETSGLFVLGAFAGNGNADGPMLYQAGEPAATFMFDAQYGSGYCLFDEKRSPYNPTGARILMNTNGAEGAAIAVDLIGCGTKIRDSNSTINYSASSKIIYAAWLARPIALNPRAR